MQTKLVKIDDEIYWQVRKVAEEKKMNVGSVIAMMFTYPCSICGKIVVIGKESFDDAVAAKNRALFDAGWAHTDCQEKKETGKHLKKQEHLKA